MLQGFDDPPDLLGPFFRHDERGIRGIDNNHVFQANGCNQPLIRKDDGVLTIDIQGISPKDIPHRVLFADLIQSGQLPRSDHLKVAGTIQTSWLFP